MNKLTVDTETGISPVAASAALEIDANVAVGGASAGLARIPDWNPVLVQEASARLLERKASPHYYASIHAADDCIIRAWRLRVPAACKRWDKLLESELISSNGLPGNLAILVQHCYLISRAEADKQVRSFLVPERTVV